MLKYSAGKDEHTVAKRPAHEAVYEKLRQQILFGDLAPGQAVTIQGVTESLGAGMTPVREAIRRLISAGALTMMGNRRITVPVLTDSCVEELVFIREKLEPALAGLAVSKISSKTLRRLKDEDDALNMAIERGDISAYLTHNYRFHARVYSIAEAPIIAATVDRLWLRFGPSLRVVCGRYGTMNLPDKHADLLEALAEGDRPAAEQAMKDDVQQGMGQIRAALNERNPAD